MSEFLLYLGKLSLIFSLLCLSYYLFFRRLSFHALNRLVLLSIIPLSLFLPFIQLEAESLDTLELLTLTSLESVEVLSSSGSTISMPDPTYPMAFYLLLIYIIGLIISIFQLIRAGIRFLQDIPVFKASSGANYQLLSSASPIVYSAFSRIFIPENFDLEKHASILKHEEAHLQFRHSYDLLLTEIFVAFSWFNPFAYLFRRMLKSLHEFQADESVLASQVKKSDYLTLLLQTSLQPYEGKFRHSFKDFGLKARVEMICKRRDSMVKAGRYLILLPIILFFLLSTADTGKRRAFLFPIQEGLYQKIVLPFGYAALNPFSRSYQKHKGIDILASKQTPIRASASGKVIRAEQDESWGNIVVIDHGDTYETRYAHMQDIKVMPGEQVESGDLIGHVGSTGLSPLPHLHYEVRKAGKRINPSAPER